MTKTSSRKATAPLLPPRPISFFLILLSSLSSSAAAAVADTITIARPLRDGETVVSAGGMFELGFFGFNTSAGQNRYVGIWYKQIPSSPVVWVANRDSPVPGPTGVLKINATGSLNLLDGSNNLIWFSSNQTTKPMNNNNNTSSIVAKLLDSGNFVLRREGEGDGNDAGLAWQSFDYPTDTLLPGMKLGLDTRTGLDRFLRSWKNWADPSSGGYSFRMDPWGLPEIFLWNGAVREYRSGPWNGFGFSGVPEMRPTKIINFTFTVNADEVFYSFDVLDKSVVSRLVVNSSGLLQRYTWIPDRGQWAVFWYAPKDQCDGYRECGPYGVCDTNASPVCTCPDGFRPANPHAWVLLRDGSDGCVRRSEFRCGDRDSGFLLLREVKMPDTSTAFVDRSMSLSECESLCQRNCSCTAYANSDIGQGGSGCVMWTGALIDVRRYADGVQDLYLRVAASDLVGGNGSKAGSNSSSSRRHKIIAAVAAVVIILLVGVTICIVCKRKKTKNILGGQAANRGPSERTQDFLLSEGAMSSKRDYSDDSKSHELELPIFDFETVMLATNKFSETNKLGQGGFGIVYKGMLTDGQEVAVKRLSTTSGQGMEEFKNEVRLIARLQHRNLVRLLGCCVEMEEKMLIYEYMQHKSLDSTLFNKERSSLLDWPRRFNIICGIARGLLYLHQDSRYRIIHRDLKASNILLDGELNPKISDFGMARIFGGDPTEAANTIRVVGTYGYMSPEYAMDGQFSVKSDVFSFGVLVLEIISGKKNRGFYYSNSQHNLLGHAWGLWQEGKGIQLIDSAAGNSYSTHEVLRCLQVGLLCVQERPEDRPTMSSAVLLLSSEAAALSLPKHPGFCMGRNPAETDSSSSRQDETFTINQVTVTMVDPR